MPKAALVILCDKPLNNRTINAIPNFQITHSKIRIFSSVISVKKSTQIQLTRFDFWSVGNFPTGSQSFIWMKIIQENCIFIQQVPVDRGDWLQ